MLEYGLEERPRVLTNVGRLASACVPVCEDILFDMFVLLKKDKIRLKARARLFRLIWSYVYPYIAAPVSC